MMSDRILYLSSNLINMHNNHILVQRELHCPEEQSTCLTIKGTRSEYLLSANKFIGLSLIKRGEKDQRKNKNSVMLKNIFSIIHDSLSSLRPSNMQDRRKYENLLLVAY